jgi:hypothetical protein
MSAARVIKVIETHTLRGDGKKTVLRAVKEYYSLDGELLAENDPFRGVDAVTPPQND